MYKRQTEETDQMVVSVNAPKAVEEDPIIEEDIEDGEATEQDDSSSDGEDSSSEKSEETKEENSEES